MSNNLKELTRAHHDSAERTEFADMLLSGNIKPKLYQEYLHAQLQNYMVLESAVDIDASLEPIFRSTFQSVVEYNHHIQTLIEDDKKDALLAHLYVRHFGDAHGGQIIKKNIPGQGLMYEFEDRPGLIKQVRELLHDGMEDEAKICFEYAERLFVELMEKYLDSPEEYLSEEVLLAKANGQDDYDDE